MPIEPGSGYEKSSSELCQSSQASMTKSYTKKVAVNYANQDTAPTTKTYTKKVAVTYAN